MKYIRTYGDYNSWKLDYSDTSRGFRLKPTLYKYSDVGIESNILLETDDPRKHGDSTYMEITLDSDTEFSFYIGNAPDDTQTTMTCTIDWGDGTVETKTITADDKGFKLSHNYVAGSYKIELYDVERDYSMIGVYNTSLISPIDSVKRVVLGGSVVSIGNSAFSSCTSLTSVYIPEGVTSIGDYAFYYCTSLTSINIPEGVTSIGNSAFIYCTSLKSIYIPEGVTSIEAQAFSNCTSLTSVYIPESVNSIRDRVFSNCTSLTSVYIPSSITITLINSYVFQNCTSLTSVYISEGVTEIGWYVFRSCTSLTSVYISEGVTVIGNGAFQSCTSLKSIDIPKNVTSIGVSAFGSCSSLTSISSLNTTAPTLGNSVFASLPKNGTLHIKPGATGYDAWLNALPSGWKIVESL